MSSVIISGDTSGSITLAAPAVAGTNTLTLPASTGNILASTSQLIGNGTTTNDSASTGQVGEYVSATPSAYTVTTTVSNPTSISLTAGDWDVTIVTSGGGASGTAASSIIGINTSASTIGNGATDYVYFANDVVNGGSGGMFTKRISIASTTTVYAMAKTAAGTTVFQNCVLSARRVR
jgi:hypothetical protein